MTGNMI